MCGGRVLLSGTRGGADIKREPDLRRALLACPLNQHTLRPAADVWGAGIIEWHTGRGRGQTGTGYPPGAGGVSAQPTRPTSRRGYVGGGYYSVAHGAGPTSNGNRISAGRYWRVRSTNTPYVPPRMCGGRVLLSGTRGGAEVKREPGIRRALVACPLNQHALRPAADMWGAGITQWHTGRGRHQTGTGSLPGAIGVSAQPTHPTSRRGCVGGGYYSVAHGAGPTSNGNWVSAGRYWRVRSTNTPYVPPWMCGRRVLLSGTRGGADVKPEPGLCRALVVCLLNQHALRAAADVWGAGITQWQDGAGPTSNGNRVSAGRWWHVRSTNTPYVPPRMCGGRVLLSGTRGGADVKREPGLCRALVVCPLNQHTLRPAADVWGAGITEWHTGRGRRQTGTGSLPGAGGVSAQPTHPTSRRGCVGGGYY